MNIALRPSRKRASEKGFVAVVVMLILLSLVAVYIAANIRSLNHLQSELKEVEQRQLERLETAQSHFALTNHAAFSSNSIPSTPPEP
jgi:hypothetical protein